MLLSDLGGGGFYCVVSLSISLVFPLIFSSASYQVTAGGGDPVIVRQLHALRLQFGCRQLSCSGLCQYHINNNISIIVNLTAVVIMDIKIPVVLFRRNLTHSQYE